jgi:hypothetical protein
MSATHPPPFRPSLLFSTFAASRSLFSHFFHYLTTDSFLTYPNYTHSSTPPIPSLLFRSILSYTHSIVVVAAAAAYFNLTVFLPLDTAPACSLSSQQFIPRSALHFNHPSILVSLSLPLSPSIPRSLSYTHTHTHTHTLTQCVWAKGTLHFLL